jgi:hypothetical protein
MDEDFMNRLKDLVEDVELDTSETVTPEETEET